VSYRRYPLAPGVVDVATARRAVAEVAQERDALARQLHRSQAHAASLQRQLAAARQERDEALAERDRVQAAVQSAEAERDALRQAAPEGDRVQRLAADLANLRRHQDDAIERGIRAHTDRLLLELLSVRDSVQRALSWLPEGATAWQDGLAAVRGRIDSVLEAEGVQPIGAPGERFDPTLHEAVGTTSSASPGHVVDVVSSGLLRADGTVVKPAQVVVGARERALR